MRFGREVSRPGYNHDMKKRVAPTRVFLSYVPADRVLVQDVARELSDFGVTVFDPIEQVFLGDNIAARVGEMLEDANAMVIFLSPRAAKSENTRAEWMHALVQGRFADRLIVVAAGRTDETLIPWPLLQQPWISQKDPRQIAAMIAAKLGLERAKAKRRGRAA